eukprot:12665602-Ditylum_brightwellii.AAC.1
MVHYTPDKIKAKFLHPTLQRIEGEPDYAAINTIMQQLYENTATILLGLGGGAYGHIGLVMKPTLYSSFFVTACNAPSAPTRATLPCNASSQASYDEDNWYKKELDTYENYIVVDDVLKRKFKRL